MAVTLDTTTIPGQTIVTVSAGGVAIDYSASYLRIAVALETIAASLGSDSTTLSGILASSAQALENIDSRLTAINVNLGSDSTTLSGILASSAQALENIDSRLTTINVNLGIVADLAGSTGIRTIGPYEWVGLVSSYQLYVEADGSIGLPGLAEYKDKINSLPKAF